MMRFYLRQSLASHAQRLLSFVPQSRTLREIVTKLSFVQSVYGPYLLNTPGDRTFELCVDGYGSFVSNAIGVQDRRFVFLDIGANLGLFSLLAAKNPHCERVIAFEPLPDIFRNLECNIRRNGGGKIEAILGVVSATQDSFAYLTFDPRHSGMSRIIERRSGSVRAPVVSAKTLDSLFPEPPDAIVAKIDVEGSEVDVLSTLRTARIYSSIAEIIIEISERHLGSAKRSEAMLMLARDGYEEVSRAGSPHHYDARYRRIGLAGR